MRPVRAAIGALLLLIAGCKSKHVEIAVQNRAGEAVQLLEVDYPSASFGKNMLAANADYPYRIQVSGSGKLRVQYTTGDGHAVSIDGPSLAEGDEGRMQIVLLPQGKAEFHTAISH